MYILVSDTKIGSLHMHTNAYIQYTHTHIHTYLHTYVCIHTGGLAHPLLFGNGVGTSVPGMMSGNSVSSNNMYETFGAVPVTARNFHKLMSRGDAVLLFPGGMVGACMCMCVSVKFS